MRAVFGLVEAQVQPAAQEIARLRNAARDAVLDFACATKSGFSPGPTTANTTLEANESEAVLADPDPLSLIPNPSALPLEEAVRRAVARLTGAFAIGVLSAHEPDNATARPP